MCTGFPYLREKFLGQRRHQIANSLGTAGAAFHPQHSLDHQDVMRSPECDIFVVIDQQVLHYKKIGVLFRVRQDLDD